MTSEPGKTDDIVSLAFGTVIAALAVVYIVTSLLALLVAWEIIALVYLVIVLTRFRNRSARGAVDSTRALPDRVLEHLSWTFPLAASATGVASAVTLLTTAGHSGWAGADTWIVGLLGSIGVIVAWALLQTGFAEIYESCYARLPQPSEVSFSGAGEDATLGDFLYLAFMVGTSFSPDGATVASRKVRQVILIHSVTSFFYNAFLIAIAIQVLQSIIADG
ncbi:DUF1345 domain-containing protein [Microbacterium sp.]|uniref:DUF1345 domain-containing protein n=1 Tax=Microbacterium sp. TaxID=51671 RepID=UPI003C747647